MRREAETEEYERRTRDEVATVVRILLAEPKPDQARGKLVAHCGITFPCRTPRAGTRTCVPSFLRTR